MRSIDSIRLSGQDSGKLLGLELLRFIAAFAVLVWHYQHFAFDGTAINVVRDKQPLYILLRPFYEYGWYGVQVFWSISGFIFFWRYKESVHAGRVSAGRFFVLRFSRLYPLHGLTLLLVAILQAAFVARMGHAFVYPNNDAYHFLLQLFMASHWGLETGYSFNGPIWSISVEVLVYAIFYACLRLIGKSPLLNVVAILFSVALHMTGHATPVSECIGFFFAGGIGAWLFLQDGPGLIVRQLRRVAWLIFLGAPVLIWAFVSAPRDQAVWLAIILYAPFALYCIAQPLPAGARMARLIEGCGNLTYSSYLLHFPLQLTIALCFALVGRPIPIYHTTLFLMFIVTSFVLAYLAYRYFERPAQTALRARFGAFSPMSDSHSESRSL